MIRKFHHAMFGFTSDAFFVIYGKGIPSHSEWMLPGSEDDE